MCIRHCIITFFLLYHQDSAIAEVQGCHELNKNTTKFQNIYILAEGILPRIHILLPDLDMTSAQKLTTPSLW